MTILLIIICVLGFAWLYIIDKSSVEHIVYISHASKRYHTVDCHFILGETIPISEKEAVKRGYTPCKSCNPDFDTC